VREAGKKAAAFCREQGADISELALRFALRYPFVSSTLIGIATTVQVETSLKLLQGEPDQALLAQVEAILAPVFNYSWPSGRPENQE
jgi:aryl-alcohol dehydrogenase-like predicted oxidoreductase